MTRRDDEHARFERPRRRTRPRTKDRPDYAEAEVGRVVTIDRGRYTLLVGDGHAERHVTAMKSRSIGRQGVVVGDLVRVVGDTSGEVDTLARIAEVEDRATVLRRTADDTDPVERVIVANADQLVVVTALADPEPRPRMIDRCLVAAFEAGMKPLVCLTKSDLAPADDLLEALRPLDVEVLVTRTTPDGIAGLGDVRAALEGHTSVLVGHSGVGKSTLVNELVPEAHRTTSGVNTVTGRGRHTSTSAIALHLPGDGWIVDTPGVRSFGLAHVDPERLVEAFEDLADVVQGCSRGCGHTASDPECALDAAVADGTLDPARVDSFRRLLASLTAPY